MKTLLLVAFVGCLVPETSANSIKWCAVGVAEMAKCGVWSMNSVTGGQPDIECQNAVTADDCVKKIMNEEADAITLDGGQVYTAGKCGLVPVMVEQYDQELCGTSGAASSYTAVAVVKKGSGVTWANLSGKKSCHTGLGKTAGWNMPMGHIYNQTNDCDFNVIAFTTPLSVTPTHLADHVFSSSSSSSSATFFSAGCAPGSDPNSPFCTLCVGNENGDHKCKANSDERHYGYAGAFRCLVEGGGDVAFIRHTTVPENSDGNGPSWASAVRSADYELICPGKGPVPITDYASCNLGVVPAHAVVTRPNLGNKVVRILQDQQSKFGPDGSNPSFRMFESGAGKNLLFKDSTQCLQELPRGTSYDQFLGTEYMNAINTLRQCSDNTPDLENACTQN
ncbi:serotransferrin-like isoform X2 [Larimichthys crocea]|uniref:serotransferrin-like isoform X2 n=1 Tax=Larimichthys crocea TaxID=215358 RepID=UPI000F5F3DFA|nr:serotransferrin-like isoform X2 [Larimichthys crocea]